MIRHDMAQGSAEWLKIRSSIPTASEFDALVTPLFERRKGQGVDSYLAKKVAEAWQGGPLPGFGSWQTEQGQLIEREVPGWFEFEYRTKIDRVGFCTTDDGRIGCSPDGLIGENSGIEIKCPNADTHVRYLLDGDVPKDYLHQVHGSMYVTGRPEWKFLSYRRHFPPLLLTVDRSPEIQEKLHEALMLFLGRFDRAMERMIEINGGPPVRPEVTAEPIRFSWEPSPDDIIP